jgi:hypothetical protein
MPTFSFPEAPRALAGTLRRRWNAPLPRSFPRRSCRVRSFGTMLDARKFSTPDRSISELLRTLSMNGCF